MENRTGGRTREPIRARVPERKEPADVIRKEDVMNWKELDDGQLLTVDEVADWLRLEKPYVYRLARTGELHRVYLGRYVRIPVGAVRAYIMANMVEAEEPRATPRHRPAARRPGARARRHLRTVRDGER